MVDLKIFKRSLLYAASAVLYVAVVASAINYLGKMLSGQPDGPLAPIGFLLLLVVSVATMGMLIFGKPVMLYIDGKKREGVTMAVCTICLLAAFTAVLLAVMVAFRI